MNKLNDLLLIVLQPFAALAKGGRRVLLSPLRPTDLTEEISIRTVKDINGRGAYKSLVDGAARALFEKKDYVTKTLNISIKSVVKQNFVHFIYFFVLLFSFKQIFGGCESMIK